MVCPSFGYVWPWSCVLCGCPCALVGLSFVCGGLINPQPYPCEASSGSSSSTQLASPADSETTGHTSAALRAPKPKKTGNERVDDQNTTVYQTTVELIDELSRDPSHVTPLWNKMRSASAS